MEKLMLEEAIAIIQYMKIDIPVQNATEMQIKRNVALDMAIDALIRSKKSNCSDSIGRQAAIDAMCELMHHWFGGNPKDEIREIKRELEKLPSAQSDTCDGCVWEEAFGYGECYRCKRAFSDMYVVKNEE